MLIHLMKHTQDCLKKSLTLCFIQGSLIDREASGKEKVGRQSKSLSKLPDAK